MDTVPLILWNHRWEYDKNPEVFFRILFRLAEANIDFKLVVLGESFPKYPKIFDEAKDKLKQQIVQFGYVESKGDYIEWLKKADIIPVTSRQDFFGESLVQAMYHNCYPLVPNRLVFPEHFPIEHRAAFVYNSDDELYEMLLHCIQDIEEIRKVDVKQFVKKYSWTTIIEKYDNELEKLAN